MHESDTADRIGAAAGGLLGFSLFLIVLFIVVAWIVFPLLVYSRIGEVLKELQRQGDLMEKQVRNTRPPSIPTSEEPTSSLKYLTDDEKMTPGKTISLIVLGLVIIIIVVSLAQHK